MWKSIPSFPEYEVSTEGQIRNKKLKILTPCNNGNGYLKVSLGRNNQRLIHRLVGETFLDLVDGKSEIDHINRNKKDNSLQNLRWVSHSENNENRTSKGYRFSERDNLFYANVKRGGMVYRKSFKQEVDAILFVESVRLYST